MGERPELSEKAKQVVDAANSAEGNENVVDDALLNEWWEAFKVFDKDSSSFIDREELVTVLRALGQNPTDAEVTQMITDADFTQDGKVDYDEFVVVMISNNRHGNKSEEEMKDAFKVFDKNGDGFVSADELKEVMKTMGEPMNDDDISAMMKEADIDGDGRINYDEFAKVICQK